MTIFHGIKVNEPVTGVRPSLEKSTAVIGLVATATAAVGAEMAALNEAFPLDRPVLVTDVVGAIGKAGSGGTLRLALGAIADQGSPLVVVVRIAAGADAEATETNAIGSTAGGVYTGLQALLVAEARTGVRPRIIGIPGFDSQDVVNAAIAVAQKLRGFVYAACRPAGVVAVDRDAAVAYRDEFGQRELMLIWPDATGFDGHAVAAALGARAMLDEAIGWHKSISNVVVNGFTGTTKDVGFDIRDQSTDAGVLNAAQVTTIIRRGGYRFWGNRGTAEEAFFAFEPATRTAQAIQDAIADAEAQFIDHPMTVGTVRDIVETANMKLALWQSQGRIIGGRCFYDPNLNPIANLSAGQLAIDYDFTPVAPLEGLTLNQRITGKYYLTFAAQLNG